MQTGKQDRFTDEFKEDPVAWVVERGHAVSEVTDRLGISTDSLYMWKALFSKPVTVRNSEVDLAAGEEGTGPRRGFELVEKTVQWTVFPANGDIFKKAAVGSTGHRAMFCVGAMCRVVRVHVSGFYVWLKEPFSLRAREDLRQTDLIRQAWTDCGKVYSYRKLHDDLRDQGETCSENRVARLAGLAGIAAQIGDKRRPGRYGSKPAATVENTLDRQFDVASPDTVWVTEITYIKTLEGWLYLAVVIDLFSRRVVGWSMQARMTTDLALQALLMSVWRRKPKHRVMVHSDQGSQFTSREWQTFPCQHNLDASMSRRGNCHDNAVAESVFQLLKRERIRRQPHPTRKAGRVPRHRDVLKSTTQTHEQQPAVAR